MALNSELRTNDNSECQIFFLKIVVLNAKLNKDGGSKRQNEDVALNAKLKMRYDGYECRIKDKQWL